MNERDDAELTITWRRKRDFATSCRRVIHQKVFVCIKKKYWALTGEHSTT
jgi:hypothetical protein